MKDTHIKQHLLIAGITLLSSWIKAEDFEKYNVIFIISDQHNPNVAGCYGDSVAITPNIDALYFNNVASIIRW